VAGGHQSGVLIAGNRKLRFVHTCPPKCAHFGAQPAGSRTAWVEGTGRECSWSRPRSESGLMPPRPGSVLRFAAGDSLVEGLVLRPLDRRWRGVPAEFGPPAVRKGSSRGITPSPWRKVRISKAGRDAGTPYAVRRRRRSCARGSVVTMGAGPWVAFAVETGAGWSAGCSRAAPTDIWSSLSGPTRLSGHSLLPRRFGGSSILPAGRARSHQPAPPSRWSCGRSWRSAGVPIRSGAALGRSSFRERIGGSR
jgi:hypothetical protein